MQQFLVSYFLITLALLFSFCSHEQKDPKNIGNKPNLVQKDSIKSTKPILINIAGNTIASRFNSLSNCERVKVDSNSFGAYLRDLPLKRHGSSVKYYDSYIKRNDHVYVGVVDLPIGKRDLHQCADAIMRLRADYLRSQKRYDEIKFSFNNGFVADYRKWKKGYRINYNSDSFSWKKKAAPSDSNESYWKYLEYVFSFAGNWSLEKELNAVSNKDMEIGDVFIYGGAPGHAVIVVDMIEVKTAHIKNYGELIIFVSKNNLGTRIIRRIFARFYLRLF
jgi:hypothetical protein